LIEREPLLRIEGLKTYFHTYEGVVKALEGIDLEIHKGETMGLVGETGCGKSVTATTVMGLIPMPPGKIEGGRVFLGEPIEVTTLRREYDKRFGNDGEARKKEIGKLTKSLDDMKATGKGKDPGARRLKEQLAALEYRFDILHKTQQELNAIRGDRIAMIFQEPMTALNPGFTIGAQISETIQLHQLGKIADLALKVAETELKAIEAGKRARRVKSGSGSEMCSECRVNIREDHGYCLSCGSPLEGGFSFLKPMALRKTWLRTSRKYYARLKENPDNTYAYFMERLPVVKRLVESRFRLAKTLLAEDALREVKIAEPIRVAKSYPYELSGGMKQRAMIAMMMSTQPDLLIADEPTTALDVTVETQILALMRDLQRTRNTSILLITHDLGVIAENCHRVAVMYAGYIVEMSDVEEIFKRPLHPYMNALLRSIPKVGPAFIGMRKKPLEIIPGVVPNLLKPPPGCRFHPRCERALEKCSKEVPPLVEMIPGHQVACHNPVPQSAKEASS